MNVRFRSVEVEGFRNYVKPYNFNLDKPGLNLVQGTNGTGKTSIFEGVVWALYGLTLKEGNIDDVVSWPEIRPFNWMGTRSIVNLKRDDKEYWIARHIGYKGETNGVTGGDTLFLWGEDGSIIQGINKAETQQIINKLVGADSRTFINAILFGQRMARLVTQDNKDKRALFEELFDVEWVNEAKLKAENNLKEKQSELAKIDQSLSNMVYNLPTLQYQYDTDKKYVEVDWLIEQQSKIRQIDVNINSYTQDFKGFEEALKTTTSPEGYDEEGYNNLKEEYNNLSSDYENRRAKQASLEGEIKALGIRSDSLDKEIKSKTSIKEGYIEQIKTLQEEAKEIKKGVCPTCHQPIDTKKKAEIIKARNPEELTEKVNDINMAISEIREQINVLIEQQGTLISEHASLNLSEEWFNRYEEVGESLTWYEQVRKNIEQNKEDIQRTKIEIEKLKERVKGLKIRKKELELEKAPDMQLEKKLAEINRIKSEIEKQKLIKSGIEEEITIIKWWSEKGFGAGGIKAFIFNSMLAQLNENTRTYGERLGVSLEFKIDLNKASKPFTTICSVGDKVNKEYRNFSGGEKQRLDIVLIFAMYDLISINTDYNILIMDEALDGLDEEGETTVFDLVRTKAEKGKAIFIITHSDKIDSLYASHIYMGE